VKPRTLHHIATRVFNTPLAIQPSKLETIIAVIGSRLPDAFRADSDDTTDGDPVDVRETAEAIPLEVAGKVAVIPVHGTLVQRCLGLDALSGMTSYQELGCMLQSALDDGTVDAILLDVDSPGGECNGLFEFAERVYEGREIKPIVAISNEQAFSAAYAIASAASKVYVTKTSNVGSIGVIATHVDQSKADEKAGLKYTHIFAGKKKADFSSHKPLSQRASSELQTDVDALYQIFVSTVARNRGISSSAVSGTEAGLYMGKSAVIAGLADEVISLSDLSGKIQESITMKTKGPKAEASANAATEVPASQAGQEAAFDDKETEDGEDDGEEDEDPKAKKKGATEDAASASGAAAPVVAAAVAAAAPALDANALLARSAEISSMCTAAGAPQLAAEYIKNGLTVEQAKAKLFDKLSAGSLQLVNAVDSNSTARSESEELLVNAMRAHEKANEDRKARR
jgi:capsid assembly protease